LAAFLHLTTTNRLILASDGMNDDQQQIWRGNAALFTAAGRLEIPAGFRRWVQVGTPLTPNGLNNGQAKVMNPGQCASCHMAGVASTDMVWVQFYPLLRAKLQ
jgi:hypothetical protein